MLGHLPHINKNPCKEEQHLNRNSWQDTLRFGTGKLLVRPATPSELKNLEVDCKKYEDYVIKRESL